MEQISQYIVANKEIQSDDIIIIGHDLDNNATVLLRSEETSDFTQLTTDNLVLKTSITLLNEEKELGAFHVLKCISDSKEINSQFYKLAQTFLGEITVKVTKEEIISIFQNLQRLFQINKSSEADRLQVGLYGELAVLYMLSQNGYQEILPHWHSDFYSKHDIELSEKCRVEVKTTTTGKRIHHFKLDQLVISGIDIYVYSVLLFRVEKGKSLYDLANDVIAFMPKFEQRMAIISLLKMCGVSKEDKGMVCDLKQTCENIKLYSATNVPKLTEFVAGVTNVSFDSDLENIEEASIWQLEIKNDKKDEV